jgi:hypothetical protein|tara:strand:+ start:20149 stop:21051 length:903 start_codon:yes stop_codon:yes gene_type:complete
MKQNRAKSLTRGCRLAILLLSLLPLSCFAFGQAGHRIICEMAYQMLTEEMRGQVDSLIRTMPDDHRKALNEYLRVASDTEISFSVACVWADVIRRQDDYRGTSGWHYINVQREDDEVELDDCMAGCLLSAIQHHRRVLTSKGNPWPRAQALMFLGHWLGDIHQPMHVSFGDDRGGNDVKVRLVAESGCGNLHLLWDVCIIESLDIAESELVGQLVAGISQLDRRNWSGDSVITWATESLAISRSESVRYCRLSGAVCARIRARSAEKLPDDYLRVHWPVLKKRMQQASVRLVWLLNDILD